MTSEVLEQLAIRRKSRLGLHHQQQKIGRNDPWEIHVECVCTVKKLL